MPSEPSVKRTFAFIDGQNLFYAAVVVKILELMFSSEPMICENLKGLGYDG